MLAKLRSASRLFAIEKIAKNPITTRARDQKRLYFRYGPVAGLPRCGETVVVPNISAGLLPARLQNKKARYRLNSRLSLCHKAKSGGS